MKAVGGEHGGPRKIAAVGVKRDLAGVIHGAHEVGDGILREDEAAVHVIAGIEEDEDVGARQRRNPHTGRTDGGKRLSVVSRSARDLARPGRGNRARRSRVEVAFFKRVQLLGNLVFHDDKILRAQAGNVIAFAVGDSHVELHQVHMHAQAHAAILGCEARPSSA